MCSDTCMHMSRVHISRWNNAVFLNCNYHIIVCSSLIYIKLFIVHFDELVFLSFIWAHLFNYRLFGRTCFRIDHLGERVFFFVHLGETVFLLFIWASVSFYRSFGRTCFPTIQFSERFLDVATKM